MKILNWFFDLLMTKVEWRCYFCGTRFTTESTSMDAAKSKMRRAARHPLQCPCCMMNHAHPLGIYEEAK